MMIIWFLTAFLAAPAFGIINGKAASRGAHPYQVAILKWNQMYCGGSIIHAQWVLTAAHCEVDDPANFKFVAGTKNLQNMESTAQVRSLQEFRAHPNYSEASNDFNIALVKVSQPFVLNSKVQPIKLNTNKAYPTGKITVSGWGYTAGFDIGSIPNELQTVELNIKSSDYCKTTWIGIGKIVFPDKSFCADTVGDKAIDICDGDSGGPAALKENGEYVLYGIVNFSSMECAQPGEPAAFLRVDPYLKWIKNVTKDVPKLNITV